jgi:hypothetical protein
MPMNTMKMDLHQERAIAAALEGRATLYVRNPQRGWVKAQSFRAAKHALENKDASCWIYGAILKKA